MEAHGRANQTGGKTYSALAGRPGGRAADRHRRPLARAGAVGLARQAGPGRRDHADLGRARRIGPGELAQQRHRPGLGLPSVRKRAGGGDLPGQPRHPGRAQPAHRQQCPGPGQQRRAKAAADQHQHQREPDRRAATVGEK